MVFCLLNMRICSLQVMSASSHLAEKALEIVRLHWLKDDFTAQKNLVKTIFGDRHVESGFRDSYHDMIDLIDLWYNHVDTINGIPILDHFARMCEMMVRRRMVYNVCPTCQAHVQRFEVDKGHLAARCGSHRCGRTDYVIVGLFL